eukprot:NODE_678_length_1713_cov_79.497478_g668_i0.p1 GENE.NODE_678_length_1713_cov_79.497478_g668_i0~~NODE_678_length_1713_cov_79.497478_g668_i0.p1  ORF type:complete len:513 (+),score=184.29 NODE_678_length_1713_cov_79.497478_g668_i0:227-1540(+)
MERELEQVRSRLADAESRCDAESGRALELETQLKQAQDDLAERAAAVSPPTTPAAQSHTLLELQSLVEERDTDIRELRSTVDVLQQQLADAAAVQSAMSTELAAAKADALLAAATVVSPEASREREDHHDGGIAAQLQQQIEALSAELAAEKAESDANSARVVTERAQLADATSALQAAQTELQVRLEHVAAKETAANSRQEALEQQEFALHEKQLAFQDQEAEWEVRLACLQEMVEVQQRRMSATSTPTSATSGSPTTGTSDECLETPAGGTTSSPSCSARISAASGVTPDGSVTSTPSHRYEAIPPPVPVPSLGAAVVPSQAPSAPTSHPPSTAPSASSSVSSFSSDGAGLSAQRANSFTGTTQDPDLAKKAAKKAQQLAKELAKMEKKKQKELKKEAEKEAKQRKKDEKEAAKRMKKAMKDAAKTSSKKLYKTT